ncbi:MAG TPA: hypothetical protein PKH43_05355 [Saprospiraceae bacterium]|nr:hypothetical protein [Saprospiraceae bacterium]
MYFWGEMNKLSNLARGLFFLVLLLSRLSATAQCTEQDTAGVVDVYFLSRMPEYPGGEPAMLRFLQEAVFPPLDSTRAPIGKIAVQYIIEADGRVSNICAVRNADHPWTQAIIRQLAAMPRFKPGEQDGKPVRTRWSQAIYIHPE